LNLRNVLRTYSLLRQLSDDESALLATLRGLNDGERDLLVESLRPTKGTGKGVPQSGATRTIAKCDACNWTKRAAVHKDVNADGYHEFVLPGGKKAGKSARAVGMAAMLNKSLESQRRVTANDPPDRCTEALPNGAGVCGLSVDDVLHQDSSYGNYHQFVGPEAVTVATGGGS